MQEPAPPLPPAAEATTTTLFRYRFGTAEYDQARQTLSVDGQLAEIEQRPLQVLEQLLQRPGEVVTREELFESVWANRPTVDNVLPSAMTKLRRALGEANAALLQTLPRVGYRLSGPVERVAVGRQMHSQLELAAGQPVPLRPHWLLHQQLGAGAAAEVWRARHDKTGEMRIYKFAADGERLTQLKREATLHRLLRESLGERPDFVRLIDWNFDSEPFFLECQDAGQSLSDWAAAHLAALDLPARLALFLQIAEAVAAAHGVGVLHKDLKPANVLVAGDGPQPQIRLADFGSARLLDPARLAEMGITAQGLTLTQALASDTSGTLLYLAPEVLAGQVPTVRSDVYALGLMLYQLVTGELRRPLLPGWEQDIADELLREDIAAAADIDPARRLASAAELCERLRQREQRKAAHEHARAQELAAAATKAQLEHARARRPWMVAAFAVLLAGLGLSLWQYGRAELAARRAGEQAALAEAVSRFVTEDLIGAAQPGTSGRAGVTMIEAARAAVARVDQQDYPPAIRAALHLALQKTLSELSDHKGAVEQGQKALQALAQANAVNVPLASEVRVWLANSQSELGQFSEADQTLRQVEADVPALREQAPQLLLRMYQAASIVAANQTDFKRAYEIDRTAIALAKTLPDVKPEMLDHLQFDMADSQIHANELAGAEATLRELQQRQTQRLGPQHQHTLYTAVLLAHALARAHRPDEAAQVIEPAVAGLVKALGADARRTLLARSVQAEIDMQRKRYAEAAATYGDIHQSLAARNGAISPAAVIMLGAQGDALQQGGDLRAAERLLRQALGQARQVFGKDNAPVVQQLRYQLADCLLSGSASKTEVENLLQGLEPAGLAQADAARDWPALLAAIRARVAKL